MPFQVPFFPTSFLRNKEPARGTQGQQYRILSQSGWCGGRDTKGLNTKTTLGRDLGLLVLLPGAWGDRKHCREVTALNVSHALTHCASPGSGCRASGRQRPTSFSSDTDSCQQPYVSVFLPFIQLYLVSTCSVSEPAQVAGNITANKTEKLLGSLRSESTLGLGSISTGLRA